MRYDLRDDAALKTRAVKSFVDILVLEGLKSASMSVYDAIVYIYSGTKFG